MTPTTLHPTLQPFLRTFVSPAALCALGLMAAMAAVLQYSLRAHIPGSLDVGGLTLANFTALLKPLYARVFLDTVWICLLTAFLLLPTDDVRWLSPSLRGAAALALAVLAPPFVAIQLLVPNAAAVFSG